MSRHDAEIRLRRGSGCAAGNTTTHLRNTLATLDKMLEGETK